MAKVQQYRKTLAELGILAEGQFGYATDTKELYIGTADGNRPINKKGTTPERTAFGLTLKTTDEGMFFYDTTEKTPYWWSGTEWV
jgi:hypothetical protein